jgi:hypothetical protein
VQAARTLIDYIGRCVTNNRHQARGGYTIDFFTDRLVLVEKEYTSELEWVQDILLRGLED